MIKVFRRLYHEINKSEFIKSAILLSGGNIISQALNVISIIFLKSRLYSPSAIGDFGVVISFSAILQTFLSLGLLLAIIVPLEDREAIGIIKVVMQFTLLILSVGLIIVIIISPIIKLYNIGFNYYLSCLLLYIYTLVSIFANTISSFLARKKMFAKLSKIPVISTLVNVILMTVFGFLEFEGIGLIITNIISAAVGIIIMLRDISIFSDHHKLSELWAIVKKYKNYIIYQMPANQLSSIGQQLPNQVISNNFGNEMFGFFSFAQSLISYPVSLIAGPINNVYYKKVVDLKNSNLDISEFTYYMYSKILSISIIPIGIGIVLIGPLFNFLFGAKWLLSGAYASILVINLPFLFCGQCFSGVLAVLEKQSASLMLGIIKIVISSLFLFTGIIIFHDMLATVVAFVAGEIVFNIINLGITLSAVGVRVRRYIGLNLLYISGVLLIYLVKSFLY